MADDDRLYAADAATYVGVTYATWRRYCAQSPRRRRQAPEPDGVEIERGHARPWWYRATLDSYTASRPGRGARTDLARRLAGPGKDGAPGP